MRVEGIKPKPQHEGKGVDLGARQRDGRIEHIVIGKASIFGKSLAEVPQVRTRHLREEIEFRRRGHPALEGDPARWRRAAVKKRHPAPALIAGYGFDEGRLALHLLPEGLEG